MTKYNLNTVNSYISDYIISRFVAFVNRRSMNLYIMEYVCGIYCTFLCFY